ncbi:2-(1,2-epoxy-1,2-dihydrophenyl)acetyl-CoA isomerase [Sphingobium boeckii]|uniref:2-(1,2-epoxy-1,2-dihydrophenyl)acetyl-CoA isomerase n=1 Tax=Sphingobium boeckii TaxID=1082345 RepID=A0A7W9AHU4_9SPHN|nr:2-(1,2-epoxy-1,2-dihydrophenyl)acetyl-CoA isomerase [Sphingobium boeckii]
MSDAPVLVSVDGAIATLTLNRPAAGNTVDLPLAQALLQAAIRCDTDAAIRCVVLTGAGKLFCGGGDIGAFAGAGDQMPAFLSELAGTLHMAVARLMRMPKPLLVLVNGPAAGAGLSLAIAGDIVIAARTAHFTAAYGSVGLSPDGGMSWHLPRLVGMRKAQEMIIANRRVSAEEGAAIGLVSRMVEDADLAGEGAKQAAILTAAPTAAIGAARSLLLASFDGPFEGHLERETRAITASGGTGECREGVTAFLARRKPDFQNGPA